MKFEFIHAEKALFPVAAMCRNLDVSSSGFYAWRGRAPSARDAEDERLTVSTRESHQLSRRIYGSPRVHEDLETQGFHVGRKRVARLMRDNDLRGKKRRRFVHTTHTKHAHPIAANVLARKFDPPKLNQSWAGDITYIATTEGWLYLAAILDLCSRKVIGWAMSTSIDTELAISALEIALSQRKLVGRLVHHTDWGCQYASGDYRKLLASKNVVCRMSRKGNCWDNACVESFFGSLKDEIGDVLQGASSQQHIWNLKLPY